MSEALNASANPLPPSRRQRHVLLPRAQDAVGHQLAEFVERD